MLQKKELSKIFFLFILVALLIGSSSAVLSVVPRSATTNPGHITLTWVGDPRTTQTITWQTAVTAAAGKVQYIEEANADSFPHNAKMIEARLESFTTDFQSLSVHTATLTGLKPGTRYVYRVGDGTGWSVLRMFTTSAENVAAFKFLVFGDSQSSNYGVWRNTVQQAYQSNQDAAFMTNVGDLVDVGQEYAQWNAWFDGAKGVIDTIPVMPAVGNHETYTPQRRFSLPGFFTAQFKLPDNGPEDLKGQVYSFEYGDAHFVVLDSQESEEARFLPTMLEKQKVWLEQDLSNTNKKWKIVFIHRPPYNNKATGLNDNIKLAFTPIFDKYHADLVFTGHDHTYARTYPLRGDAVMDSPDKGTVYVATGRSGTKTYKDTSAKKYNSFFYNPIDEPNYLTVEVRGNSLTVKAYKQGGTLIDVWTIDKRSGTK